MHYYQFNIADYRKDTVHLSLVEHAIYRELIDQYHLDESPIPLETQSVIRRLRLASESDISAFNNVLTDFFVKRADGWHHKRVDQDIVEYRAMAAKNKANGKLGGRPKKTQSVSTGNPLVTQTKGNQEPITNNQEPVNLKSRGARGSRLNADWRFPSEWIEEAFALRPHWDSEKVRLVADSFRDYWISVPGSKGCKLDWLAVWRNWVRNQRDDSQKVNGYKSERQVIHDAQTRAIFGDSFIAGEKLITGEVVQ
jgi:uncharacterized protein YdaU (DUF1376 family)